MLFCVCILPHICIAFLLIVCAVDTVGSLFLLIANQPVFVLPACCRAFDATLIGLLRAVLRQVAQLLTAAVLH
jgi:hypothetical protein